MNKDDQMRIIVNIARKALKDINAGTKPKWTNFNRQAFEYRMRAAILEANFEWMIKKFEELLKN